MPLHSRLLRCASSCGRSVVGIWRAGLRTTDNAIADKIGTRQASDALPESKFLR